MSQNFSKVKAARCECRWIQRDKGGEGVRGSVIDPVCRCVLVEWFAREERGAYGDNNGEEKCYVWIVWSRVWIFVKFLGCGVHRSGIWRLLSSNVWWGRMRWGRREMRISLSGVFFVQVRESWEFGKCIAECARNNKKPTKITTYTISWRSSSLTMKTQTKNPLLWGVAAQWR